MVRHLSRAVPLVAAVLLTLALVGPVAAANPAIRVATIDSAFVEGGGSFHNLAEMSVPAGTWWLRVTGILDASRNDAPSAVGETVCRLSINRTSALDQTRFALRGADDSLEVASLLLTSVYTSPAAFTVDVDCASTEDGLIYLRYAVISAVQGSPSSSPRLLSSTPVGIDLFANSGFQTAGDLQLPAGRWSILAKANVSNPSAATTVDVKCVMRVGGSDIDETAQSLAVSTAQGFEGELAVEVAHTFRSAATATLSCGTNEAAARVDQVRIVAIKAGKLTRRDLVSGTTASAGTGTPKVISAARAASVTISATDTGEETVLGTVPLRAGHWLVAGKLWLHDVGSTILCMLSLSGGQQALAGTRGAPPSGSTGLYLQVAGDFATAGTTDLKCRGARFGDVSIERVRMTAISASSITVEELP